MQSTAAEVRKVIAERRGIKLDLACGPTKQGVDWVGLDRIAWPGVDIVWDLEKYPWPIPDECVLVCIASHIVEHISRENNGFFRFMDELWRVMRPEAQVAIAMPYGFSPGYMQDPGHVNPCTEATFAYLDPIHPSGLYANYLPKPWKYENVSWHPVGLLEAVLSKRRLDPSYIPHGVSNA